MNMIDVLFTLLTWGIIGFLAYRIYQKQEERPRIWKIMIVIIVGIFSFSLTFPFFYATIRIALLPLGVWILYAFLKNKNWNQYRKYAWLGFLANYIFLSSALLSLFIYHLVYDEASINHHISDITEAKVIPIHPTGKKSVTLRDDFINQISSMERQVFSLEEMLWGGDYQKQDERFPYLLVGSKPRWGSGLSAVIYIEQDGKGIIINTDKESLYFRSDQSLLKEGESHE